MEFLANYNHWNVSGYNYSLEICSILFLLILLIKHFSKRSFPTQIRKIYNWSILCAALDITMDITGSILINNYIDVAPQWLTYIVNGSFYIFQVAFPALMFGYVLVLLGEKFYKKTKYYYWFIPCALFILITILNPVLKWIFYLGPNEAGNLAFLHGKVFIAYYITAFFYFILTFIFSLMHRSQMSKKELLTIIWSLGIIIAGIVVQIALPSILLTGFAITTTLYIVEDNIANPDDMVDKISGAFNFNALSIYFDKVIRTKKRKSFITINVESLSPVNDTFGAVTGNKIYKKIGSFLNDLQPNNLVFRIFSSKFVLSYINEELLIKDANKIKERFQKIWDIDGNQFFISCDITFFTLSNDINDCDEFLNFTSIIDSEVQKQQSHFLYIDENYIKKINREIQIEKALSDAFGNKCQGFYMCYQPIYNCKTKKFDRAEALLRFNDPFLGAISPGEFIPIAEKAGYAEKLDEYVLKTVSEFLKKHSELNTIHVNISGAEFFHNPADKFIEIINKAEIDPHRICFEITETASIKYPQNISKFMDKLIQLNAEFAIDDFGTGYSNISELFKKPFRIVKIDKTLLEDADNIRLFLTSINHLFKELKYTLVIEGVETKKQKELAEYLQIDYIQGFLFSKPLTEDDYIKFIEENKE